MGGAYDLLSLVRNLRSNKVTDRKRAVSGLKSALQNQSILISIDQNTLKKSNQTWDIIAINITKAIELELEKFAESSRKKSSAVLAPGTDLLAIVSLLRTVVQQANRRQPLLNPRKVVDHIQQVLEGRHSQLLHGQYTSILQLVLSTSSWQVALTDTAYNGLVDLVCGLLRSSKGDADIVGLSNALHHLVATGFYQDDAHLETVLKTLAASFVKLREMGTVGPVVLQLSTLVDVGRRLAGKRRHLLCAMGERIARSLLVLFNWNSLQIKELALEFLALQLSLHGTGTKGDTDDEGDLWQSLVRDWHHLLMEELQKRASAFPGLSQQQARVRRAQVWLAAETLEQMEPAGGALATVVSTLQSSRSSRDALPWLEVLACYLWKYPTTAGRATAVLQKLLDVLTQCHSSCKIQDVKRCVLLCYWGVARAHGPQAGKKSWPLWHVVWEQTVKMVFLNQCVEEGHLLLQELLRQGLVCSDLSCLLCPGRPLEPATLHSLAVLLSRAGSLPHLDVPPALLDHTQDVPAKHRWRLWLLELLVPGGEEGGTQPSTLVPASELLAAICLARPAAALASTEITSLACTAWQDPYPWRAKLEADLQRRANAQPSLCQGEQTAALGSKDTDKRRSSEAGLSAAVVEVAWKAALDKLSRQCSVFLESAEMLPACLYTGAMGAILMTKMCRLQAKETEALLASPPVKQLQSCLRDCTEKLLQELDDPSSGCSSGETSSASQGGGSEQRQRLSWLGLLGALLSYVDGGCSGTSSSQRHLWHWLLDALPQELGACLLSTCRGPEASLAVQPTPSVRDNHNAIDSDDDWVDENVPSCSATPSYCGSLATAGDIDPDFSFEMEQPAPSDTAATKCSLMHSERLTIEEVERLASLRIGLCHFLLSRRVTGVVGSTERTFQMLVHLLEAAEKNLTAWNIQAALQVLQMLLEHVELMAEPELFSVLDILRQLMKVHYRQLDVLAALLDVARLCVPAVNRHSAESEVRSCFQVILQACVTLQAEGILNEAVCVAFLRLLLECSQGQSWIQLQVDGRSASPLDFAARFLGSPYDSVRTLAVQSMAVFLKGGDPVCLDTLLPHIDKHLRTKAKTEDEHLSSCLVLATALANAALTLGPHLGGVATAALLQAVRDSGLPATLAAKVLGCTSKEGTSCDAWSMAHLPCVVHLWLKQDLPLRELPLAALGSSSPSQFLERHWRLVLPAAVECGDRGAIKFVSDTLGHPAKLLLSKVAPVVMSHALACWDGQGSAPPSLRFLEACLSPEVVEQVLVDRIAEVLVSVLQLACSLPGHAKRELYPPCLSDSQVKATLQHLAKKCCALVTGTESLMDALLRKRDGLQQVLQGLQGGGARGEEPCPLSALTHLAYLVAPALDSLKGSECYVLRMLTLQLLRRLPTQRRAISADEKRVTCLVARALHHLYEAAAPHMLKEVGRNLPVIINALAPFVDDDNIALGWEVQALMKLLLSDRRFDLPVLCVLPLPDCNVLTSCRGPLEAVRSVVERERPFSEVLDVFAQSLKRGLLSGYEDPYVLSALSAVLRRHRTELTGLLKAMQEKPFFSEAAANSPLHQLVAILFQQAKSTNQQVRAASLRCLGLLGPTELGLPALATAHWNPISGMVDSAGEECSEVAYALLFSHVERYLCHPDTKISGVACQVLKAALATRSAFAFITRHRNTDMEDTFAFLHPFLPSGGNKARLLERPTGPCDPSPLELWVPDGVCEPAVWIQNLVCTLVRCCDDQVFWALLPLCQVAADLCELLFPFVVETLADEGTHWDAVVSGFAIFLERHAESRARDEAQSQSTISSTISSQPVSTDSVSGLVYCSRASVAVVMSAVERMVVRRKASATTLWGGLRLKVDLLKAAQAAEFCGNHAMAVQCVELWWDWNRQQALSSSEEEEEHHSNSAPLLQWKVASGGSRQQEAVTVQSVLLGALSGLGDPDALAGCRCLALGEGTGRTLWRHFAEQRGGAFWPTLLARADLEATGRNARLAHALKQCGLYHTLSTYLDGCETPDLTELQAECAWRLADWDCRLPTQHSGDTGFQHGIFITLSSMACHEAEGLSLGMNICRELLSCQLSAMPQLGSSQQLNQLLARAQMCTVLEEGVTLLTCIEEEETRSVLTRWEQRVAQPGSRFDFSEPVSWLQGVVAAQLRGARMQSARTTMLAHYAVQARLNQRPWLARVALKELERCAPSQAGRWLLEEARIQLAQGECTEAQHTLWTLLRQLRQQYSQLGLSADSEDITRAYAEVLQLCGACLAESGLESSDIIAKEYFGKAVELLSGHHASGGGGASLWAAHLRLARFADAQLQSIEQHLHSPEFRAQQELLQQCSHLLQGSASSAQGRGTTASREDARTLKVLERQMDLDRGEVASLEAARGRYLRQAVAHYLQCLRGGPEHDLRLFRLASLWVGNATMPEVNDLLEEGLGKLASYKFVPLIYQLAARMSRPSGSGSTFAMLLLQLIERVVRDHPYQTLPVVLALCNAEKDPTDMPATTASRAKKARTSLPAEDRVEAARYLVSGLHKGNDLCAAILPQLERLMDAYIQLAYIDPPNVPRGQASATVKLPRDATLLKLTRLDKIPVLTQSVEVDQNASYLNLPGILRFSDEYHLCGGINQPKVIACLGQDGRKYKQLVKGRDDLRQDAVMQQVFSLVNRLLAQEDGHQGTGKLAMRTYKVVPLSRRSGLVQWCEGTQPFSEFLLSSRTGAHQRYHPQDWTPVACRSAMQAVHKSSPEERLLAYQEICRHFHPVFRYFFFENFPEPSRWFERRRAYIYSVATGSIVGYILGLGDRHCANILVDKHSAELIHIDLGVAFEQGRILTTPETVPFRLTRDIVDGMGICGVEGTFRRCCERTMEVMRASRELLVTVVEVLLHDPLSSWTLSPKRVAALQRDAAQHPSLEGGAAAAEPHQPDQRNRLARRMLLRLEQKLRGLEEGVPLSVAGQVNLLIQQAVNPHNLSRLFPGWQPYV